MNDAASLSDFPAGLKDRFLPRRLLGRGGFGAVWLALQTALDRPVALKTLHAGLVHTEEQVQRFRDEARLTASIRHPGVVTLLDHGVDEGVPWMAFEYVEGTSLRSWVEQGRTPWRRVLEVGRAVAHALDEARQNGIIHRDIKPDNILMSVKGELKLADFGIAKWSGNETRTAEGMVLGTPAYLSPMQVKGHIPAHQSDLYALGVTLFELLTGITPFVADNPILMLEKHISAFPPPVRSLVPEVPEAVERLLAKLLSKDRAERFDTAAELAARITEILDSEASGRHTRATGVRSGVRPSRPVTTALRPPAVVPAPAPVRRWPLVLAAAGGAGMLAMALWLAPHGAPPVTTSAAVVTPAPASPSAPALSPELDATLDEIERTAERVTRVAGELAANAPADGDIVFGGKATETARARLDQFGTLASDYLLVLRRALAYTGPLDDRLLSVYVAGMELSSVGGLTLHQAELAALYANIPPLEHTPAVAALKRMITALEQAAPGTDVYRRALITHLAPLIAQLAGPGHNTSVNVHGLALARQTAAAQLEAVLDVASGKITPRQMVAMLHLHMDDARAWKNVQSAFGARSKEAATFPVHVLEGLRRATGYFPACWAAIQKDARAPRVEAAARLMFAALGRLSAAQDATVHDMDTAMNEGTQLVHVYKDQWAISPHPQVLIRASIDFAAVHLDARLRARPELFAFTQVIVSARAINRR